MNIKSFGFVTIALFGLSIFYSIFFSVLNPAFAQTTSLQVNTNKTIRPYTSKMNGQGFVNWEHSWGKPYLNSVPGLAQAMKEAKVGIIRYAGGLWANSVGWDRTTQKTPYTTWSKNGNTYYFHYGTDEVNSVAEFANTIGADVIVQVDISRNDPSMWADMVKYVNKEGRKDATGKAYYFKYWELGNELDFDKDNLMTPTTYATRFKAYQSAMLAVDPTIKITASAVSTTITETGTNTQLNGFVTQPPITARANGSELGALTYHWYQGCGTSLISDVMQYQKFNGTTPIDSLSYENRLSRYWGDMMPRRIRSEVLTSYPTVELGITESNFDACNFDSILNGNHINAVRTADLLGRLAYSGIDFVTWYTAYGTQGYSLFYPDNDQTPTRISIRPRYYAHMMYAQYFGDIMVESLSYKNDDISIWASRDSKDPSKLKLMITNLTGQSINTPVSLTGFSATSGNAYEMSSTNPTDMSSTSNTTSATTTINKVKIDGMNVAKSILAIQPKVVAVTGSSFSYSFPAYSTTAIVLTGSFTTSPSITPTPTNIVVPTATPIITLTPTTTPTIILSPTPTPTPTRIATPTPTRITTPTITPTRVPTGVISNFSSSTITSPSSISKGGSSTLSTTITVAKNGIYLIDVEVYSSAGAKIYQKYYDNQTLTTGIAKVYAPVWKTATNTISGTYTVRVGIFSANWGTLYHWNANAGKLSIK
ncbi:MAG: hypothetical protein WCO06_06915 [Candidatus Roizmanbacteria bacterium]